MEYSRLVMHSFGFQHAFQRGIEPGDHVFFKKVCVWRGGVRDECGANVRSAMVFLVFGIREGCSEAYD